MVAGIMSISGWVPVTTATDARIGRIISVVAVLLVSSVRNVRLKHTSRISTNTGSAPAAANWPPMNCASPVCWKAAARAKPPPMRSTTFHGKVAG